MVFITFAKVFIGFPVVFLLFSNGFHISNGFPICVRYGFHWFCYCFDMFLLLFSFVLLWSCMIFFGFAMVLSFAMVFLSFSHCFPMALLGFAMVFLWFSYGLLLWI